MSKRMACAYIPNFALEVLYRENPSLALRPVALTEDIAGEGEIVSINDKAFRDGDGARIGMTAAQARVLVPGLHIITRDGGREREVSDDILAELKNIGPFASEDAPGIFFLDTSGLTLLYKSEKGLAKKIIYSLRTKLFPIKVGIAKNKFLARAAAEVSDRSGYTIITAGAEERFLKDLSTQHLNLSDDIRERLSELGIKTIGELSHFNRNEITHRFGREGEVFSLRSKGDDPDLFTSTRPEEERSRTAVFTYSLFDTEAIISRVERLLDSLLLGLKKSGLATTIVVIGFRLDDRTDKVIRVSLDTATNRIKQFKRQIDVEFEKLQLTAGVDEIKVIIPEVVTDVSKQLSLPSKISFNTEKALTRENLANIPDAGKLHLPELIDSFLPERNYSLFPASSFTGRRKHRHKRKADWVNPFSSHLVSGMRLLQPPREVEVRTKDGKPQSIVMDNVPIKVVKGHGPWQLSGDWWKSGFDRLYYEIETRNNKLYLLYFDRLTSRWYIHGVFD
jgi:nucleotidyltransferase/DNA polymerase involved in DNA repair